MARPAALAGAAGRRLKGKIAFTGPTECARPAGCIAAPWARYLPDSSPLVSTPGPCCALHSLRPTPAFFPFSRPRSMADNIHSIIAGKAGAPPVFEWVMLGISAVMCVVGALFVSYSIK